MKKKRTVAGELILFSLPLIGSGILQQLYSWADAFIVGHVEGELPLAAVGATSIISSLLINIVVGFTFGLSIMGSQEVGRDNKAKIARIFTCFLPILAVVYVVFSGTAVVFSKNILTWMGTPSDIFGYSHEYLRIVLLGMPFIAVYNLYAALLRSLGNTRAAFYAVLISSVMNVGLDILFMAVFGWGVAGAAIATVISQFSMTAFMVLYGSVKYPELRFSGKCFDGKVIGEGVKFAVPPMIQNSITSFGSLVLQNFMNGFGSTTVLAITTAYRVDCIMLLPILNLGAAMSNMVARSEGAEDRKRIRSYFKTGSWMMVIVCVVLTAAMYLFGADLVAMFGVTGEALRQGGQFFKDLSIFYLLFGLSTAFRGTLEGMGDITCCSILGIVCLGARIGLSYLMEPFFGTRTIAFAEGVAWIIMLAAFTVRLIMKRKKMTA